MPHWRRLWRAGSAVGRPVCRPRLRRSAVRRSQRNTKSSRPPDFLVRRAPVCPMPEGAGFVTSWVIEVSRAKGTHAIVRWRRALALLSGPHASAAAVPGLWVSHPIVAECILAGGADAVSARPNPRPRSRGHPSPPRPAPAMNNSVREVRLKLGERRIDRRAHPQVEHGAAARARATHGFHAGFAPVLVTNTGAVPCRSTICTEGGSQ